MRRLAATAITTAMLGAACDRTPPVSPSPTLPAVQPDLMRINGIVVEAGSDTPVAEAWVWPSDFPEIDAVRTDGAGRFAGIQVPRSRWLNLRVDRAGYEQATHREDVPFEAPPERGVRLPLQRIIRLAAGGRVSGILTNESPRLACDDVAFPFTDPCVPAVKVRVMAPGPGELVVWLEGPVAAGTLRVDFHGSRSHQEGADRLRARLDRAGETEVYVWSSSPSGLVIQHARFELVTSFEPQ